MQLLSHRSLVLVTHSKPHSGEASHGCHCSLLGLLLGGSRGGDGRIRSGRGSGGGSLAVSNLLASESLLLADGVLGTTGLSLALKIGLADDLSLGLVDSLNKHILVLELVTLGGEIELVVHLAVDLLLVPISAEEATEDAKAAHPQNALGHTGAAGTLTLTGALMATFTERESG